MVIGFVILSHRDPEQLLRLCRALATLYDEPPIACHHDFSQSALDLAAFPACVSFVRPSLTTSWGKWVVIEATLAGIALLYDMGDPNSFVLLSGSDYPAASAETVKSDIVTSGADVFLDGYSIVRALKGDQPPYEENLSTFRSPSNIRVGQDRYLRAQLKFPLLRRTAGGGRRVGARTIPLPFDAPFAPFSRTFQAYFGTHWFTGSREVAKRLLRPTPIELRLQRYLRGRVVPEESYIQTVIMNDPAFTVDHRTRHYADWKGAGSHPAFLTVDHLDEVHAAGAHFARKFLPDDPALDVLDRRLGIDSSGATGHSI